MNMFNNDYLNLFKWHPLVRIEQNKEFAFLSFFYVKDAELNETTGLSNLSVEVLHSLLLLIQQYLLKQPTKSIVNSEEFEKFLDLLRKG